MTKNKNIVAFFVTFFLLALLEFGVFNNLLIFGVRPELLLIGTLFFGFNYGAAKGLEAGLLSGILKGVFGITVFGVDVFSFAAVGFLAGVLKNKIVKDNFIAQFFLANLAVYFIAGIYFFYIKEALDGGIIPGFLRSCLSKGIYTGVLAPVVFLFLSTIFKVEKKYEK
ncbi:MAG: rod shape-determining protein MreD [Candidatus Omnitrophota bacterium]